VSGNSAVSLGEGGGIDNGGTLTITRSIVSGNTAEKAGGIHLTAGGTITVNRSEVSGNTAADIGEGFDINTGALTLNPHDRDREHGGNTGGASLTLAGHLR
jgi:hypothetical protein